MTLLWRVWRFLKLFSQQWKNKIKLHSLRKCVMQSTRIWTVFFPPGFFSLVYFGLEKLSPVPVFGKVWLKFPALIMENCWLSVSFDLFAGNHNWSLQCQKLDRLMMFLYLYNSIEFLQKVDNVLGWKRESFLHLFKKKKKQPKKQTTKKKTEKKRKKPQNQPAGCFVYSLLLCSEGFFIVSFIN